jgi:hypothetical protein
MPTRKQRRRRAKEHRHEYVWEDAEGNELDREEALGRKPETDGRERAARPAREPQAPSWQRTFKRALIFAPVMFIVVTLLSGGLSIAQQLVQTGVIVALFIPFSYFMDSVLWRSYQRRVARANTGRRG